MDKKSQIQALDRTAPMLPMQPGLIERRSHDYYRHGTTTLFAALDIATGQVTAALKPRHRHQEFLAFLKQIERTYRDVLDADGEPVDLHLVMDNYAAHKHPNVKIWLALAAECYPDEHRNLNSTTSKKLSCWAIHGIRPRDIFACVDDGR